ncbi:MAG: rhomboid family intramembrane serine protease [Deltaproteobacteria bacterium]|nr:rhomboid family intramembrane serine protease [Deltaproteobacteria bacterium]
MRPLRLGSVVIPPITAATLVVLVVAFILSGIAMRFPAMAMAFDYLPVTTQDVLSGQVWRVVTYALLHDLRDPFHLIMNGLVIFWFGRQLEERWATGRYLLFMFLTVLFGGLFVVVAGVLGLGAGAAQGASAFAYGLMVAWGLTYRERELRFMFAIPMKGIHMVWVAMFFWVLDAVSASPHSAAAHLGGMVTAAALVLGVWNTNKVKLVWASFLEKIGAKKATKLYVVPASKGPDKKWVN